MSENSINEFSDRFIWDCFIMRRIHIISLVSNHFKIISDYFMIIIGHFKSVGDHLMLKVTNLWLKVYIKPTQ